MLAMVVWMVADLAEFRSDSNQTSIYFAIVAIDEIVMMECFIPGRETEESIATVTGMLIATTTSLLGGPETAG